VLTVASEVGLVCLSFRYLGWCITDNKQTLTVAALLGASVCRHSLVMPLPRSQVLTCQADKAQNPTK